MRYRFLPVYAAERISMNPFDHDNALNSLSISLSTLSWLSRPVARPNGEFVTGAWNRNCDQPRHRRTATDIAVLYFRSCLHFCPSVPPMVPSIDRTPLARIPVPPPSLCVPTPMGPSRSPFLQENCRFVFGGCLLLFAWHRIFSSNRCLSALDFSSWLVVSSGDILGPIFAYLEGKDF